MDFFLRQIADAHEYVWPIMLFYMWILSRRLRNLELRSAALAAEVALLVNDRRLAPGQTDGTVRIYPD